MSFSYRYLTVTSFSFLFVITLFFSFFIAAPEVRAIDEYCYKDNILAKYRYSLYDGQDPSTSVNTEIMPYGPDYRCNDYGFVANWYYQYGTDSEFKSYKTSKTYYGFLDRNGSNSYGTKYIGGLTPNTTYYFKLIMDSAPDGLPPLHMEKVLPWTTLPAPEVAPVKVILRLPVPTTVNANSVRIDPTYMFATSDNNFLSHSESALYLGNSKMYVEYGTDSSLKTHFTTQTYTGNDLPIDSEGFGGFYLLGLKPDTTYYAREVVSANPPDRSAISSTSEIVSFHTKTMGTLDTPHAPRVSSGLPFIKITWAPVDAAVSYNIYKKSVTSRSIFSLLLNTKNVTYDDYDVLWKTEPMDYDALEYCYKISAISATGQESSLSGQHCGYDPRDDKKSNGGDTVSTESLATTSPKTVISAVDRKAKDFIQDKKVPEIVVNVFKKVFGRQITPAESKYWKSRARSDAATTSKLLAAMKKNKIAARKLLLLVKVQPT